MNARVKKENMEEVLRDYWENKILPHVREAVRLMEEGENMDMKNVRMVHQHIELAEAGIKRYRHELFLFHGEDKIFEKVKNLVKDKNFAEARRILGL